jgi:transposase
MSLKPTSIPPIPEETARVARAAFPCGHVVMQLRDTLGTIYTDDLFVDLFPTRGQPAEAPWRLALITIFGLHGKLDGSTNSRCSARSVGLEICDSRLELTDPGFHHTVLSEFRTRMARTYS